MRRRSLSAASAVLVLALAALLALLWYEMVADRSHPRRAVTVIIPRGDTLHEIAAELASEGVIGNALTFRVLAKLQHADERVRAGEYRFAAHMTQREVLRALVTGGAQVAIWVTIPEGFTAAEIAQRLADARLGSIAAFQDAFRTETLSVAGARTKSLEGFLFPSTYLLPLGSSPQAIAAIMTGEFFKQLPGMAARGRKLYTSRCRRP